MPVAQFLVRSSDLNAQGIATLPFNYNGKYNVQLLSLQYHDGGGGGVSRVIQLVSDDLYLINSPARFITLLTNPNSNINIDSSTKFNFDCLQLKGFLNIQPVDLATGTTPAGFTNLVLTLQINDF
jgi:hypothetical protein